MAGKWSFFVDDKHWFGSRDLFMRLQEPGGRMSFVGPLTLIVAEPGTLPPGPTMSESREEVADNVGDVTGFLRAAMQAAWDLGMRPDGFADHAKELTAVRYHLEDMRTLGLAALAIPKAP